MIRAQQAASQSGQSTLAMSYSQIARTYDIRKATLLAHRDVCLAHRTGTADGGVPVRSDGVPGRTAESTDGENANDSARYDRYGAGVPASGPEGADAQSGRATGLPGDGTDRHIDVPDAAQSVPSRVAQRDAGVVVDAGSDAVPRGVGQSIPRAAGAGSRGDDPGVGHGRPGAGDGRSAQDAESADASSGGIDADASSSGVGQARPPERSRQRANARARDPVQTERGQKRWQVMRDTSVETATERLANAAFDAEITDPNARAHGTYIQEVVEIIGRDEWDNTATVTRLARAWGKTQMFVIGCYRDACALRRMARGSPNEDREVSLVRWMNLYKLAVANGDPMSLKVASDALKGYDAASGIVDKSTRVQVNVLQDPAAREFIAEVWEVLRQFPGAPEALRARLEAKRSTLGELPAVEVVDAAG